MPEDICLQDIYREWVHTNYGGNLGGGIVDNVILQMWCQEISVMPASQYNDLGVKVGRCFMEDLSNKTWGVRAHRWNAEHSIVFQAVILQCACYMARAQAILQRIGKHIDV